MATITTRAAKGSALTFTEVDNNFTNLNNDGISNSSSIATLQSDKFDKVGGTISGATTVSGSFTTGGKVNSSTENNSQSGSTVTLTVPGAEIVRLTNNALVSISGVQAGSSGQKIILVNRTGTTVEIENESSSATAQNQIFTGTGGSLLLNSNASISLTYDATTNRWNMIGGTGAGTGAGLINYIENPDASIGITGYTTYDDGAAAPVDGSGGTPKPGLWARSTTSPLRGSGDFNLVKTGATNYEGNGVAYDFTIDRADLAKVLAVTFDYEVLSGTYATGDLTVYIIQDPTGTPVVIQPAGYQVQAATVGTTMKQIATFQTASNVTNYRLCIHVASPSTLDYSLALDSISVGPQIVQYGAPVTDWTAYTPAAYVGLGTPTGVSIYYRRNGDSIDLMGQLTTGTVSGVANSISLPAGLSVATGKGADSVKTVGRWYRDTATGSTNKSGTLQIKGGESVFSFGTDSFTGSISPFNESVTGSAILNSTEAVMFEAQGIPIQGWSSTVQFANDTDTRVVAAAAEALVTGTYSTTAPLDFSTVKFDTHGAVTTGASWKYTAPVPGYYRVSVAGTYAGASTGTNLFIYKNGSSYTSIANYPSVAGYRISGSATLYLASGDYVDIRPAASISVLPGYVSVERLSGPSAIAASESVIVSCIDTSGVTIGTTDTDAGRTLIQYAVKEIDTHGAFSSGIFTAPISGKYEIHAAYGSSSTTGANMTIHIYKNGASLIRGITYSAGTNVVHNPKASKVLSLVAGDTVEIRGRASTATALDTATGPCWNTLFISRVGN